MLDTVKSLLSAQFGTALTVTAILKDIEEILYSERTVDFEVDSESTEQEEEEVAVGAPVSSALAETCSVSLNQFIEDTKDPDPKKRHTDTTIMISFLFIDSRLLALRVLCPCRVKRRVDPFWARIIEMTSDSDGINHINHNILLRVFFVMVI